jgi:pilus assembly protein CpaC
MKNIQRVAAFFTNTIFVLLICFTSVNIYAGGPAVKESDVKKVPIFKSRNFKMKEDIHRVSIGNDKIADILVLRGDELYVVGKTLGTTNIMIWDENDKVVDVINLEVTHDLNSLRERFYHYLPNEKIGVESSQGQLVLSGEASSLEKMNLAVELARAYAEAAVAGQGSSQVLNMTSVGGGHQVMLEVTVAEVQNSLARTFDTDMSLSFEGTDASGGIVDGGTILSRLIPDDLGVWGEFISGDATFNFAFDVAKTQGLAKVLAEPNITALSGQQAQFLSGGEFPIPVTNDGDTTIEYRDYGVGVTFVPTVLDSGKINLNLIVSVSELSTANGYIISTGTYDQTVPGVTKRTTSTTVELGDGQTIAIGGLISDNFNEQITKFPGLGDIPILGQLFRSQEYIKGQTELVIMVTPRLVRPFNKEGVALPTDGFVASSDWGFYLLGKMTTRDLDKDKEKSPNQEDEMEDDILPDNGGTQEKYGHELTIDKMEG